MALLSGLSRGASRLGVGPLGVGQAAITGVSTLRIDAAALSRVCLHRLQLEGCLVVKGAVAVAVAHILSGAKDYGIGTLVALH